MTQKDLAEKLVTAGSTISNWETGRRLPSIVDLTRIADVFGVSISAFGLQTSLNEDLDTLVSGIGNVRVVRYKADFPGLPKGFSVSMVVSVILVYGSLTFSSSAIGAFLFISGLIGMSMMYMANLVRMLFGSKKNVITRLVPLTSEVGYETDIDQKTVEKYHRRLWGLALTGLGISMVAYGLMIHLTMLMRRPSVALLGGFVLVLALGVHVIRVNQFKKKEMLKTFVRYDDTSRESVLYPSLVTLFVDMSVFASIVFQLLVDKIETVTPTLAYFTALAGMVSVVISVLILVIFQRYDSTFGLTVSDLE
jgi:DNA-binding XRE family transcriptional regulator